MNNTGDKRECGERRQQGGEKLRKEQKFFLNDREKQEIFWTDLRKRVLEERRWKVQKEDNGWGEKEMNCQRRESWEKMSRGKKVTEETWSAEGKRKCCDKVRKWTTVQKQNDKRNLEMWYARFEKHVHIEIKVLPFHEGMHITLCLSSQSFELRSSCAEKGQSCSCFGQILKGKKSQRSQTVSQHLATSGRG